MNIVVLSQFQEDSSEEKLWDFTRAITSRGHRLSFVLFGNAPSDKFNDIVEGRILSLRIPVRLRGENALSVVEEIYDFSIEQGNELLHLYLGGQPLLGAIAAARLDLPYVVSIEDEEDVTDKQGAIQSFFNSHFLLANAAAVFCAGKEIGRRLIERQPRARCVELDYSDELVWDKYLEHVSDLETPDYHQYLSFLTLLEDHPDKLLFSGDLLQQLIAKEDSLKEGASTYLRLAELEMIAEQNARTITRLSAQLDETTAELNRIRRSLGWRVLSPYGRIKYRYLLPLYRLLGLNYDQGLGSSNSSSDGSPFKTIIIRNRHQDIWGNSTLLPEPNTDNEEVLSKRSLPASRGNLPDIVCFSIIDWEFRYQRPQQIMSLFASRGHRVFYISVSRFLPSHQKRRINVRHIKRNILEVQVAIDRPQNHYGEVISGSNCDSLLDSLDELRQRFGISQAISYVMIASWGEAALGARTRWGWQVIYDCMDEWETFPLIKEPVLNMEALLVRESNLTLVSAQRLFTKWKHYSPNLVTVRNGVDYDFYSQNCVANSLLQDTPHPIVGYYGAIADWFDLDLLAEVARQRPDYSFVLLGGIFDVDVSKLQELPNVSLLGQQPYEDMPRYLYHFDVCMIPFKINVVTEATNPVKLYEYLSAGKPVVATALPEVEAQASYLYVARTPEEFASGLDKALTEEESQLVEQRKAFARENTWDARYETICNGMSNAAGSVSIIIVTYNNLSLTRLCLASIIKNTAHPNYEVIVIDNNSKDDTQQFLCEVARKNSQVKLILNDKNHGFARANNQGLEISRGDYIVLLNNDTVVPPGWLNSLIAPLRDPGIGLVGPMTNAVGNEAKLEVPYRTWAEMEYFAQSRSSEFRNQIADIKMLAMYCLAMRRDTYDEIGPLDEQFGIGMFEDDDYSNRAREKGLRVVCAAGSFVHHFGQAAFKELIRTGDYNPLFEQNRSRFENKWNTTWVPHVVRPLDFKPHKYEVRTGGTESKRPAASRTGA